MTIYALSSGPGTAGIAVIRVSGKNTVQVIKKLTGSQLPKPRVATLKKFNKNGGKELIDEGVIIWFPAPNSYTGEDLAEIHVHGSKTVVDAIQLSISEIENCRLAEPGEFTKIAFQNGKINLLKAESIGDLIASETEIQRKQAVKIMNGKSSERIMPTFSLMLFLEIFMPSASRILTSISSLFHELIVSEISPPECKIPCVTS